jgi:hypothetical protein
MAKKHVTKSRKRARTTKQINAIKSYSHKGLSANNIQGKLRARGLGMNRARLLRYVRRYKHIRKRAYPERHIPRKYRKPRPTYEVRALPARAPRAKAPRGFLPKRITLKGRWKGKRKITEKTGTGRDLYDFVRNEMTKAEEHEGWDGKPEVFS